MSDLVVNWLCPLPARMVTGWWGNSLNPCGFGAWSLSCSVSHVMRIVSLSAVTTVP